MSTLIVRVITMQIVYEVRPAFGGGETVRISASGRRTGSKLQVTPDPGAYGAAAFERVLDAEEYRELMERLQAIRLPLSANGPMGLDGVSYRLSVASGFTRMALEWWLELPADWHSVAPFLDTLRALATRRDADSPKR